MTTKTNCRCDGHAERTTGTLTWTNHGTGNAWVASGNAADFRIDGTTLTRYANDGGKTLGTYASELGAMRAALRLEAVTR